MTDDFAGLLGLELMAMAHEDSPGGWDRIDVGADGAVSLVYSHRTMIDGTGETFPAVVSPSARFVSVVAAIRDGRLRLFAAGDASLGNAKLFVPEGLLEGNWRVRGGRKGNSRLTAADHQWRELSPPAYFRPRIASAAETAPEQPAAADAPIPADEEVTYRSGAVGAPTSWHLVEAECRRRYKEEGERHPKKDKSENVSEWARLLVAWLKQAHPKAARMGEPAARNNLRPLVRKLERGCLK